MRCKTPGLQSNLSGSDVKDALVMFRERVTYYISVLHEAFVYSANLKQELIPLSLF